MNIHNPTSLKLAFFWCQKDPPAHHLTFVIKGTFAIAKDGTVLVADEQAPPCGDVYEQGDATKGCRYPSDFAPYKPRADVMVVGTCHAQGTGKSAAKVGLRVEGLVEGHARTLIDKSIAVVGNRKWTDHPASGGRIPSPPEPFQSMPLQLERAFGGPGSASNPLGTGFALPGTKTDALPALPNLELADTRIKSPEDRPMAAWLGALDRRWADRASLVGTYGADWLAKRWPWFPEDFDWAYFNAAPRDQQVAGYLRGDERVTLEGLHPEIARLETTLPGIRPRCFVRRAGDDASALEEARLVLDTAWIDADKGTLVLVWRGAIPVRSKHFEDIAAVIVGQESLHDAPRLAQDFIKQDQALTIEELADEEEAAARAKRPPGKQEDTLEEQNALEDARKMLRDGNVPSELMNRLENVHNIDSFLAILRESDPKPDAAKAVEDEKRAREAGRSIFAERGLDPSVLDPEREEPAPESEVLTKLTREEVLERRREGRPLDRVDLSGVDLSGIDFSGAQLKQSSLSRAIVDGANFTGAAMVKVDLRGVTAVRTPVELSGAVLRGANLDGAMLPNAKLDGADLTGVMAREATFSGASFIDAVLTNANLTATNLTGAVATGANLARVVLERARMIETKLDGVDLEQANLHGADLTRANLTAAQLEGVNASRAVLSGAVGVKAVLKNANMTDVNATHANLSGADLSGATLDRCKLDEASLSLAVLERAHGAGVSMKNANLTELRASGCALPGVAVDGAQGDKSLWTGADLPDATFTRASLEHADFSEAQLQRVTFDLAVMKQANLTRAQLDRARLTKVNLFRGFLEGADLSEADCRGSNFFECELMDTITTKTRFERSNLGRTKLESRMARESIGGAR